MPWALDDVAEVDRTSCHGANGGRRGLCRKSIVSVWRWSQGRGRGSWRSRVEEGRLYETVCFLLRPGSCDHFSAVALTVQLDAAKQQHREPSMRVEGECSSSYTGFSKRGDELRGHAMH
jgi:hypothetical protein